VAGPPLTGYTTPAQEPDLLGGRLVVITGVGRSGTTVLGKLVGSMDPAIYLFEPAAFKYLPFLLHADPAQSGAYAEMIRSLVTEDYLLPAAQGRSLNWNPREDSYVGHYLPEEEVRRRWRELSRRSEVLRFLRHRPPMWVVKTTEYQTLFDATRAVFAGARFVQAVRNGGEVVSSALKRGWYSDEYLNRALVDWARRPEPGGVALPWYLDEASREAFASWGPATRAAAVWRVLTEAGLAWQAEHPDECLTVRYEELVARPEEVVDGLARHLGLEPTELTRRHLASVRAHRPTQHPSLLPSIEHPERERFAALLERLGYQAD
jgi:hypothetical protein